MSSKEQIQTRTSSLKDKEKEKERAEESKAHGKSLEGMHGEEECADEACAESGHSGRQGRGQSGGQGSQNQPRASGLRLAAEGGESESDEAAEGTYRIEGQVTLKRAEQGEQSEGSRSQAKQSGEGSMRPEEMKVGA